MHMVAAMIAAVRRTALNAVMFGHRLAVLAVNAIGIQMVLEPFETGRIIGKLRLEGF
jgi:hypothetical protein